MENNSHQERALESASDWETQPKEEAHLSRRGGKTLQLNLDFREEDWEAPSLPSEEDQDQGCNWWGSGSRVDWSLAGMQFYPPSESASRGSPVALVCDCSQEIVLEAQTAEDRGGGRGNLDSTELLCGHIKQHARVSAW